ncbi:hypothetical protein LCGC14_0535290 [marine sediment metagenome]|uniref:Uncharacterized protein n=1 Tax=marine sediment metagenome TaxID=412755 RepID=A0A0F9UFY9_9ZZZZ
MKIKIKTKNMKDVEEGIKRMVNHVSKENSGTNAAHYFINEDGELILEMVYWMENRFVNKMLLKKIQARVRNYDTRATIEMVKV